MQKKKLMLLPLVGLLTACGGPKINWQEISREEFLEAALALENSNFNALLNLKKSYSVSIKYRSHYEGTYDYRYSDVYQIDYDGESEIIRVKNTYDYYDFNSEVSPEPDTENEETEYYLAHAEGVGVVGLKESEGKKEYVIAVPEEDITSSGDTEDNIHKGIIEFLIDNATWLVSDNFWFAGFIPAFESDNLFEPDYWGSDCELSHKFHQGDKEGYLKGEMFINSKDEDDISEGDAYVCDITGHIFTEFNNFVLKEAVYDYQENGLFYKTPNTPQKYEYQSFGEVKTTKYKQPKLPSLSDYELVEEF